MSAQGFEPRTHALEGRCSIQLSYAPIFYYGAGNEIRTRDFHLGKVTLYHWTIPADTMAGITGLEPVTHWLTVNCSTNWAIFPFVSINISKSISGVLYLTIIFLGLLSPISSSDLPTGGCEQHPFSPILVLLQVGFTRLC